MDGNYNLDTIMPASWVPYIRLTRLDQPTDALMPMLLYSVGLTFAACVTQPLVSVREYFELAWLSNMWLFIMHHALCTFNDAINYEYDRRAKHRRLRPVAQGLITPEQAHQFSSLQIMLGAWVLRCLPERSHFFGVITTLIMMIHPYGKRFTYFPQFIRGFGFTVSVLMACTAIGVDISPGSEHFPSIICLGLVCMLIVVIADVIYNYQDMREDAAAGVKSMTLVLGDRPKTWLWTLTAGTEGLLLIVGHQNDFSCFYYLLSCGGSLFALSVMLALVDLRVAADCTWWFRRGAMGGVFAIVSGLYIEYVIRLYLFS